MLALAKGKDEVGILDKVLGLSKWNLAQRTVQTGTRIEGYAENFTNGLPNAVQNCCRANCDANYLHDDVWMCSSYLARYAEWSNSQSLLSHISS